MVLRNESGIEMAYSKKLPLISENEFLLKAKQISQFISPNQKRYEVVRIQGDEMVFNRLDAKGSEPWKMNLKDVYKAYSELTSFETENFRPYLNRTHSPARALLLKLGLIG